MGGNNITYAVQALTFTIRLLQGELLQTMRRRGVVLKMRKLAFRARNQIEETRSFRRHNSFFESVPIGVDEISQSSNPMNDRFPCVIGSHATDSERYAAVESLSRNT